MTKKSQETQPQEPDSSQITRGWAQQMMGALIGALLMGLAMQVGPLLGWTPGDRTMLFLIGGAAGALVFSLDRFAQAGSRLTGRTEGRGARLINVVVALLGMALIIGLFIALSSFFGWFINLLS